MKFITNVLILVLILICTIWSNPLSSNNTPSSENNAHQVYIAFRHNQNNNHCTQVIKRFSGQIVEKLKDFAYPVYLVSIDNPLPPVEFEKQVVSKMEQEKGVRFASLQRKQMRNMPLMAVKSVSMQRHGAISISAPKVTTYDYTKGSLRKDNYHKVLTRHIPGLKSKVRSRSLSNRNSSYKATFELEIDKNGEVKHVRMLKNNIKNAQIRKQLKQKIYTWKDFPRRSSDDIVTVRFNFSSN
jgi:hypothetical protein